MSTETIEQWGKFSQSALDSLKALTAINTKLVERLSEQQFELAGLALETGLKGANLAVAAPAYYNLAVPAPAYKEYASGQTALAGEYGEKVLAIVRKTTGVLTEARDQYSAWTEGQLKDITTPIARGPRKTA